MVVLASLLAGLALTGCGGSSDPPLTKAEFIKQADAICRKGEAKRAAAVEAYALKTGAGPTKPITPVQLEHQTRDVILPPIQAMTAEVGELAPPSGDEEKVEGIVSDVERAIKEQGHEAEALRKATEAGKEPAPYADPFRPIAERAKKYGLTTCFVNY